MSGIRFMKWYMLIFGTASVAAIASALGVWDTPLGQALIWCAAVMAFVVFVFLVAILWSVTRHR